MMDYTLLIPTHCVKAGTGEICPWAPSTKLIETSIDSVFKYAFYDIKPKKVVVAHDYKEGMAICDDYHANLQALCSRRGYQLQKNSVSDWRTNFIGSFTNNFINLYDSMKTELGLLLEHDWVFTKQIDLSNISDLFKTFDIINHLRFNWHINDNNHLWTRRQDHRRSVLYDFIETRTNHRVIKTDVFSNNPHIIRKSAYHSLLRRFMIMSIPSYGPIEGPIQAVFDSMTHHTNNDYKTCLDSLGYCLYGSYGEGNHVDHLDSNKYRII